MTNISKKTEKCIYKFSKEEINSTSYLNIWSKSLDIMFMYITDGSNRKITYESLIDILNTIVVDGEYYGDDYLVTSISLKYENIYVEFSASEDEYDGILLDEFFRDLSTSLGDYYNLLCNLRDKYVSEDNTKSDIKLNPRTKFIKLNYGSTTK